MKFTQIWIGAALAMALTACGSDGNDSAAAPASASGGSTVTPDPTCTTSAVVGDQQIPNSPLFTADPMGPMLDVTCEWQRYQPADDFCVQINAPEFTPGGTGPLMDGRDPACQFSGFTPEDTNLYKVQLTTPPLCPGCRRVFFDFSAIPEDDPASQLFYAHGHVFYRVSAFNPTYTIDPDSHSPNTKNFYNDKLVSPPGTPIEQLVGALDTYFMAYVTHTSKFAHTGAQGSHYIGPWYVNRAGERIHGAYVDVNVGNATSFGDPNADAFRYLAVYNTGQATCPDNLSPDYAGVNFLYAGCVDGRGGSSIALDPFAP